ncbi:MAG: hypothetical protein H7A53_00800 [Akkermansiaceae bacterium]|nr:hypothetical protein [Akkermansiaceae bacterium]MCP5549425.1 hypothetical protein [Akkermansiaceae bacterium]
MNTESQFRELLSKLLDDRCDAAELESLASLCATDPTLAARLREELAFSEMLRAATRELGGPGDAERFAASFRRRLAGEAVEFETALTDWIEGEAGAEAEVIRRCWADPSRVRGVREALVFEDLLQQAVAPSRSEDAFVESLVTRMWAEQENDRFVAETRSKIVELHPEDSGRLSGGRSKILRFAGGLAAAAAVILGAFVAYSTFPKNGGDTIAEVSRAKGEIVWREGASPTNGGAFALGRYVLESGSVVLKFRSGAEMTLEAPADIEIRGDRDTFVHSGVAMVDRTSQLAGAESEKFHIHSRGGLELQNSDDVIGVDAREMAAVEAVVFNGGAEICVPNLGSCRNIYEYEAVRADLKREKLYDIPYNPSVFADSWELLSGVEANTGAVRVEMPGFASTLGGGTGREVRLIVESGRFTAGEGAVVDAIEPGQFAAIGGHESRPLSEKGELRSYLLRLTPAVGDDGAGSGSEAGPMEASVTFSHPIVGVICGPAEGGNGAGSGSIAVQASAGASGDEILISSDSRTVNLRLRGGAGERVDQVRVLVALR